MRRIFLPLLLASVTACSSREAPDKAVAATLAQDSSLAGRSSAFVDTVAPYERIESAPALGAAGSVRRTSVARRSTSSRSSVSTGRASSTSSASSAPAREPVTVVEKNIRRDTAIGAATGKDLPGGLPIALPAGAQKVAPGAPVPHVIVVAGEAPSRSQQGKEWVVPERRARRPNPVPAGALAITRGREVYRQECRSCHGMTGRGDGPKAAELDSKVPDLTVARTQAQTDGALFWKITEGRGDMPNTKTALSDEQRWMVVHYIRTLTVKLKPGG